MADFTFDTAEAAPEDLRDNLVAKDGKFVVSVVPSKKLDEFRTNNLTLSRERDNMSGVIGRLTSDFGFDPEKYDDFKTTFEDLRATKQQVEDGKLIKDTSLDEAVTKRTGEMQRQHQTQVNALETSVNNYKNQVADLQKKLDDTIVDREVGAAVANKNSGVRPDAIRAVIREAHDFFRVKEGKLVPLDHDGQVIYGADGTSPMTPLEWIKTKLIESSPFLFLESSGGGAGGGAGGGLGGLTQQQLADLPPSERIRLFRESQNK